MSHPSTSEPILLHYTCVDAAPKIDADLLLRPWRQPALGDLPLVWLTDLDPPDRDALGLTSRHLITCDRMAHRFVVADAGTCQPWHRFARTLPASMRWQVETAAPGLRPIHWWVSLRPVSVQPREPR